MNTPIIRSVVDAAQELFLQLGTDGSEFPVQETIAMGIYVRQVYIPAGVIGTGKIHKKESVNLLPKGKLILFSETLGFQEKEGATNWVSPKGSKRMFRVEQDAHWVNVFKVQALTIEEARLECYADTWQEYEEFLTKE